MLQLFLISSHGVILGLICGKNSEPFALLNRRTDNDFGLANNRKWMKDMNYLSRPISNFRVERGQVNIIFIIRIIQSIAV